MVTRCRVVFAPLVTLNQLARVFLWMDSCSCAMSRTWFIAVWSLSRVQLFATPGTAARQVPLSFIISRSLLKFMSIELVMLSNHLIPCHSLLLLPPIFPSIRVFFNELAVLGGSLNSSETICSFGVTSLKAIVNS